MEVQGRPPHGTRLAGSAAAKPFFASGVAHADVLRQDLKGTQFGPYIKDTKTNPRFTVWGRNPDVKSLVTVRYQCIGPAMD